MHVYSMQPDFDKFECKRSPDAMVNNYTRLQARERNALTSVPAASSVPQLMH
jgi:hypothetical protein